jgi:hypothetical protein
MKCLVGDVARTLQDRQARILEKARVGEGAFAQIEDALLAFDAPRVPASAAKASGRGLVRGCQIVLHAAMILVPVW